MICAATPHVPIFPWHTPEVRTADPANLLRPASLARVLARRRRKMALAPQGSAKYARLDHVLS